ncbi:hypothetical protein U1Q18_007011 [Sarracenia purpurea var. burkii]
MGCFLGTPAAGDETRDVRRRLCGGSHPRRNVERLSDAGGGGVRIRRDGVERVKERIRHSADPPAPDRIKPKPGFCLKTSQGWPSWLCDVAGDAIKDWPPRRANTFEKIDKIGQGTYSNVYKARDLITGKIVALKKVRLDNVEPETMKFVAREILILKRLDHPNVIKLQGLVTSRISSSIYLVFEYMEHDLSGLAAVQGVKFTEPQIKCYMKQLLSGLEHCHNNGVLHRDMKGSNLLIDNEGILKIADFGLGCFYDPKRNQPMTSRVVTLWYRPPELLLGATYYDFGVDLWSVGCILAELLAGKPIMPGRTEVEQLHKIFKLCGSPSEEYWNKSRLPNANLFKPQQPYKRCISETFNNFPSSSLSLIETLLTIDPHERGSASAALHSEFFITEPYACEPSCLPKYPPSKEIDVKLRDEEARRHNRGLGGNDNVVDNNRRARDQGGRAIPAPRTNEELHADLNRWTVLSRASAKSKSGKFPPPHRDGAIGHPLESKSSGSVNNTAVTGGLLGRRWTKKDVHWGPSQRFNHAFIPTSVGLPMDFRLKGKRSVSAGLHTRR